MKNNTRNPADGRYVVMRVDKKFYEMINSYRGAVHEVEGYKMSIPQATAKLSKKLMTEKKWW